MKKLLTIMALVLATSVQAQNVTVGLSDDAIAAMHAAKIHQDSIDVSSLVVEYDYECRTQDADNQSVTDRMKLCLQIGQHCTDANGQFTIVRIFPRQPGLGSSADCLA